MNRWLKVFLGLIKGEKPMCPHCGGVHLDYGYIILNESQRSGYGAVWCNDCHHAFTLSRVQMQNEEDEKKVIADLPDNLVFV